ncbi:MAG: AbrB/MazE/SpoVT family DNA-binding domain-containing protein [Sciscionella sp.]
MTQIPGENLRAELTATKNGRLTIPAQLRRAAGIEAGRPLVVYVEDARVIIETRRALAERIRRDVARTWRGHGSVVDELLTERRAEAAREDAETIR